MEQPRPSWCEFRAEQITEAASYLRAGASAAAAAEVLGVPVEDVETLLAGGEDEGGGREIREAFQKARRDARIAAEVKLATQSPAAWLKLQADHRAGATKRFRRLLGLPRFQEVQERLAGGQSTLHVARVVQDDWGLCLDMPRDDLVAELRRYRADVLGRVDPEERTADQEQLAQELDAQLDEQVDVALRLQWLVNVQTERVKLRLARERADRRLDRFGFRDVLALSDALDKLGEFQMEAGLVRRAPLNLHARVEVGRAPSLEGPGRDLALLRESADRCQRKALAAGLLIRQLYGGGRERGDDEVIDVTPPPGGEAAADAGEPVPAVPG